jgi:hypothetical protein
MEIMGVDTSSHCSIPSSLLWDAELILIRPSLVLSNLDEGDTEATTRVRSNPESLSNSPTPPQTNAVL